MQSFKSYLKTSPPLCVHVRKIWDIVEREDESTLFVIGMDIETTLITKLPSAILPQSLLAKLFIIELFVLQVTRNLNIHRIGFYEL